MNIKRFTSARILGAAQLFVDYLYASKLKNNGLVWPEEIVVSGFFSARIGIGKAAELTAAQLERSGFIVHRHDVSDLLSSPRLFKENVPGHQPGRAWILHLNAPEVRPLLARINPRSRPLGARLGYWVWELPIAPKSWAKNLALFDFIVSPSKFAAQAISGLGREIGVLPHPFKDTRPDIVRRKKSHGQPYKFLVQMDGASSFSRKNILAVIEAFKLLPENSSTRLLVKTQKLAPRQRDEVAKKIGASETINWIDQTISDDDMQNLIIGADCVVSAHRSEGFGLALAEAIAHGKDVLATGWSGNLEFMSSLPDTLVGYELVPLRESDDVYGSFAGEGAVWADINIPALAKKMAGNIQNQNLGVRDNRLNLISGMEKWKTIKPGALIQFDHI